MRNFSLQQRSGSCLPFLAVIRVSIYRSRRHTIPGLIIFLKKEAKDLSEDQKQLTTSTRHGFQNTYLGILGRILCPEENWKRQRLVEIVEYFAAPLDNFRLRHWLWRHPGGILYAFISKSRMLSQLERSGD